MTGISLLYERSETDELGIKRTAEQQGVPLSFLPFHKVAMGITSGEFHYRSLSRDLRSALDDTQVIINRTQGKHRRILAATLLEGYGKHVINPLQTELFCQKKIWTMMRLWSAGVKVPDTLYIPCDVKEALVGGGVHDNSPSIMKLAGALGDQLVLKSDEGTHGKGIYLAEDDASLQGALKQIEPSIINPAGVIAQEYVNKWFYDLRIVVEKHSMAAPFCHPTAMARGGFKDFRTNTFLGNMVFRVNLPQSVKEEAVKCGEALGGDKSYVIALDAMPQFTEPSAEVESQITPAFKALETHFAEVVKAKKTSLDDFALYTKAVEDAYGRYMSSEPYSEVQSVIADSLHKAKDSVLFHEANACPDFWEQTRIVGGVDIASSLLGCAQSLLDH